MSVVMDEVTSMLGRGPMCASDLSVAIGREISSVRRVLRMMHKDGDIHILQYVPSPNAKHVGTNIMAVFALGSSEDAPVPAKKRYRKSADPIITDTRTIIRRAKARVTGNKWLDLLGVAPCDRRLGTENH